MDYCIDENVIISNSRTNLLFYLFMILVACLQGSPQTQGVMTRASAGNALHSPGTYQLVMDPRLGLIVGTVTSPQATPGVFGKKGELVSFPLVI
jgi:hypothetical protein